MMGWDPVLLGMSYALVAQALVGGIREEGLKRPKSRAGPIRRVRGRHGAP